MDSGIGRYISNLVENLLKVESSHHYTLFLSPLDMNAFDYPSDRVAKIAEHSGKYSIAEHWTLAAAANGMKLDLFHAPHYVLPYFLKVPPVVTVHDIIHVTDPGYGFMARNYARMMIGSAVCRARKIIAVSGHTKERLVNVVNAPEDKIKVIHNGVGDFHRTAEGEINAILGRMGIKPGYFLFTGSDRPHKNLGAVAGVMEILKDSQFVIAGRILEDSRRRFEKLGNKAMFFGNVSKEEMQALYSGARALLFPSYDEGFGLPPLEAMACGVPVVASSRAPMPEILGDAAMMADPDDHKTMADALVKIVSEPAFREAMVARGFERLKMFSWEKMAIATLQTYEEAARS